jgi:transcriptional regulator with XRE-family HTH domain
MGTKINPDGGKIRALRIKRGWTQEQLAEIAGISLRTVQRAESSNSAAFETMKAIAAAFENDFDQLLKQEPDRTAARETQSIASSESHPDPAPEQIVSKHAPLTVRRIWPIQMIAISALTVGLVIGITITYHLAKHSHIPLTAAHSAAKILPDAQKSVGDPQPQNKRPQNPSKPKVVRDPIVKTAIPNPEIGSVDKDSSLSYAGIRTAKPADVEEIASLELIQPSSSPELPPLKTVPMRLVLLDGNISETSLSDTVDPSVKEAQTSGAVRQAVGVAVKKTSGFVSKARESIKRAF